MQLSEHTKRILENFVTINNGIVIQATSSDKQTSIVRTTNNQATLYGTSVVPEQFTNTVVLYDLNAFLNVLAGFNDPDVTFNADHLIVSEGSASVKMVYADPRTVIHKEKDWNWDDTKTLLAVTIKKDVIAKILKMADVLSLPTLKFSTKEGKVFVQAVNTTGASANTFDVEVGESDKDFTCFVKREYIKMIPGDYLVEINDKALQMTSLQHDHLKYLVALDQNLA